MGARAESSQLLQWEDISQDGKTMDRYINEADIPLIYKTGDSIGTIVDSTGVSHKLTYSSAHTDVQKIKGGFNIQIASDRKSGDDYITLETYKNVNGYLTLIDFKEVDADINDFSRGKIPTVLRTALYISDIKDASYVYFRVTISKTEDSEEVSDEIFFKIRPQIISYGYNLTEGSYVLINNESTDKEQMQFTGYIMDRKAYQLSNPRLPLRSYQIDANIPLHPKATKLSFKKKNTKSTTPLLLGSNKDFWVSDFTTEKDYQINAKLAYIGTKVNIWVHDNQITDTNAEQIGKEFDSKIYSSVINSFGKESDVDGDGKINLITFDIKDDFTEEEGGYVGGYFNQNDLHQTPNSNGSEILYIDTYPALGKNKDELANAFSTIAHELQHLVNHNQNVIIEGHKEGMDVWLDEALSMAAEQIYTGNVLTDRIDYYNNSYSIANGHSLLYWDYEGDILANYALSYLFGQYVKAQVQRGDSIFKEILTDPNNDYQSVESVIKKYIDPTLTFGKFTTHFRAAMIMKEQTGLNGFFGSPIAGQLKPRLYARDNTSIRGGGALVIKIDPYVGFFQPTDSEWTKKGTDLTYTILSTNHIPASQIPIQRFVVDTIKDIDELVTGIGLSNGKITIKVGEQEIASGTADATGKFSIKIPKQNAGTTLKLQSTHPNGISKFVNATVKDGIPPEKPTVNQVKNKDTTVTGEAENFSEVVVSVREQVLSTDTTSKNGSFAVEITPQPVGTILTIYVKDGASNKSEAVSITVGQSPPAIEVVFKITNQDRVIKGVTDPNSTVYVKNGSVVMGKGTSNQKGEFSISIPAQNVGTELTVYAENSVNMVSEVFMVTVTEKPGKPRVQSVGDNSVFVKGKAVPDIIIIVEKNGEVIGETVSDSKGIFTIKMEKKQKAGTILTVYALNSDENKSDELRVTVKDLTPPKVPTITTKITTSSTTLSGKGEIASSVYIYNGSKLLGKVVVDKNGNFKTKISSQKKGTKLTVFAKDKAGNKSIGFHIVVK
jgi:hypothetical protein